MSTNYGATFDLHKVHTENSVFEQLSETDKRKILDSKGAFDTLLLRDKTIAMADLFYFYMKRDWGCGDYRVVDVGVGGGRIPIHLYKNDSIGRSVIHEYHGIDIDDKALTFAQKNAEEHGLTLQLHKGNFLEPLKDILAVDNKANIALTANLPYNTDAERDTYDEVVRAEPRHAIVGGGEDGLDMYRIFLEQFKQFHDKVHILILQGSSRNTESLHKLCNELTIPGMKFYLGQDNNKKQRFVLGLRMEQHLYDCPNM